MDNVLAKKFQFKLDAKSTKMYKDKSFVCYDTDSLKWVIEVLEEDEPKSLGNSEIEVVYSYPNKENGAVKQVMADGGIEIEADGTIVVRPKNNCLIPTDYLRIDINIYDQDEFITLQPFMFRVIKSIESEIYEKAEDVVKTMKSITEQMASLIGDVEELQVLVSQKEDEIDIRVQNMVSMLEDNINNTNDKLIALQEETRNDFDQYIEESKNTILGFVADSNNEIDALMERINNSNVELDEIFLRSMSLTPINEGGKMIFTTNTIMTSPYNLINKTYILNTTGSPYTSNVVTSNIGLLYFTLEGDNVVINYTLMANKTVQGKNITVTPLFGNNSNIISSGATNFEISIKTNLLAEYASTSLCTITSNTTLGNNL